MSHNYWNHSVEYPWNFQNFSDKVWQTTAISQFLVIVAFWSLQIILPRAVSFLGGATKKLPTHPARWSKTENKKGGAVTQLGCFFTPEQKTHTNHWLDCPCFRSEEVFHSPYFFPKSKQFHLKTDWVSPGPKEFERGKTHATVKTHNRSVPTGSNSLTGGDAMFNTKGSGEA